MIQKFKRRTILILTMIFWVVLNGILLTVNVFNYQSNLSETRKFLSNQVMILEINNETTVDEPIKDDGKISRIYSVIVDKNENYTVVFPTDDKGLSEDEIIKTAKSIINSNKDEGIDNHFRYKIEETDSGRIISFVSYLFWENQQKQMIIYSILIDIGGMVLLFVAALLLTGWIITPVMIAFHKQKQFISDAGHELKTPLTVVKASLDMMESEEKNNKYYGYIREENKRMTELVYELLAFSNLENEDQKVNFEKLDLSRVVEGACLPFECVAFEKGIQFQLQIQENISIHGNEKQIRELIDILIDNAIKHTYEKGNMFVQLSKEKGRAVLRVKNEGDPIPEEEKSKIFDRFYRIDKARNRKDGRFGLGLAIASRIAELHKGKISVECKDNCVIFSVIFILC